MEPDLESRRKIFAAVEETPGIHFRHLLEQVDYAQGTLQYHLRRLAEDGLVEASDDGKFTRYYPAGSFTDRDQDVMNALRRKNSRRIIAHLLTDGQLTTQELSERLEKSQSTVSWHLSKLAEVGLVTKEREGRAVHYSLADPDRARYLYIVHQQSFTDTLVDRLLGLWEGY